MVYKNLKKLFTDKSKFVLGNKSTPDIDLFISFLEETAVIANCKDELFPRISAFRSRSARRQAEELPGLYLYVEKYIFKTSEEEVARFRKDVGAKFETYIATNADFQLIFLPYDQQVSTLCNRFLRTVAERIQQVLGVSSESPWGQFHAWLTSFSVKISFSRYDTLLIQHPVLNDYANISHDFFHEMEGRFSTGFILNYYNDAYNRLSDNFQNLDAFHELINLFPDKVLDEGKLNLLSIQQIKKLLLEKVDNLEKLSLQLHLKNEQLEQINSELHAQSDLVNEQNKKLQDAQNTIEENNKILQNYTQNLEKLVDQRTKDLENANSILKQYNQGLEEHAFAISHHVKAPVARLLGLINLINNHPSEVDSQNILARIEDSAHDLEDTLMQLVQSLNIKKDASHIVLESFDLRRMIQSIVEEMKSVYPQVPVQLSVSGKEAIHSDKNYMTDVLRHLLDNIFKFRNPDIELKIEAKILTSDKRANISIRDNGLGFNLALVKNKLFSPFQRFNIDKPGKGMGLYFTRQLVDVLGGAIEIESTPGMGTRVVISLPNNHQPDVARQFTVAP